MLFDLCIMIVGFAWVATAGWLVMELLVNQRRKP